MEREKTNGILRHTRLENEPADYLKQREVLRLAEIGLMQQVERVAALRRALPQGAAVTDYAFREGPQDLDAGDTPVRTTRMRELFTGDRPLVIYHFMYGKKN